MSVEERLRGARPAEDASWDAGASTSYDAVVAARSRQRVRRLTVTGGVAAAAVVAAAAAVGLQGGGSKPAPSPAPPTTSLPSPSAVPSNPVGAGPLEGGWHTHRLTRDTVAGALLAGGVSASEADRFAATLPDGYFRIHFRAASGIVRARFRGQPASDVEFVTMKGSTLVLRPISAGYGSTTYRMHQSKGWLSLQLVHSSVSVAYDGFPALVHYLATYTTSPFKADDP